MPPKRSNKRSGVSSSSEPRSFHFINLSDGSQVDEQDKDLIRTQAITDYHRKKKRSNDSGSENDLYSAGPSGTPLPLQINKFRLQPPTIGTQNVSKQQQGNALDPGNSEGFSNQLATATALSTRERYDDNVSNSNSGSSPQSGGAMVMRRTASGSISRQRSIFSGTRDIVTIELVQKLDLLAGSLEPLLNLPSGSSSTIRAFVDYYFNDRSHSSLLMTSVRKSWFRTSLQDPAFFNAIVSHYAARFSLSAKQGDPVESLMLRMKSIEIVNERLDTQDGEVTDGTIGAVASLVIYEANNGSPSVVQAHIRGLERMVAVRGGFHAANFPPSIQRLIAWADLTAANVLSRQPKILSFSSPGLNLPPYRCTASPKGPIAATAVCPDYLIDFSAISPSMTATFANLRFLSYVLELKAPFSIAHMDSMWYSDKLYLLQRNLVYFSLNTEQTKLDTACCIAAAIYTDSYLTDLGFHSGIVAVMVNRLKKVLEEGVFVLPGGDGEESSITIFWILAVGGISAMGKPEQQWFLKRFRSYCEVMRLVKKSDVEDQLQNIVWTKDWSEYLDFMIGEGIPTIMVLE